MSGDTVTPKETQDWKAAFLLALTESPNVAEAARLAGIARKTAYAHRKTDEDFASAWNEAIESSTDDLVGECYRRARHGCEEPVYYRGEECGRIRKYSDTLAIFLLKAHRREVYGEVTKQIHDFSSASDEELITQATRTLGGSDSPRTQG